VSKKVILALVVVLVIIGGIGWHIGRHGKPAAGNSAQTKQPKTASSNTDDGFNKKQYSLTDPNSIWVVVNKQHPLSPISYAPNDLRYPNVPLRVAGLPEMQMRSAAAAALEQMFAGANAAGYKLMVSTAYRSYTYQQTLYSGYVSSQGQAAADQESARPGYSEHQTGLAVDIRNGADTCSLEACFGTTPEGEWLAANSYKYGFILRYPADKESVTGYEYEPWHFRYVGPDLAAEMHKQHIETLEEFFDVSGGPTYK
jgi:D-alanyl-D-alanine carboxypeptidase